ncbi:hypothetical protein GCM10009862_04780 [Microbacterium binotii]|uniref:Uncharacterized protein n=1 Tax=Microbacterium binotii TaxID=462710 RepID=A0ABP6BH33_9MICO
MISGAADACADAAGSAVVAGAPHAARALRNTPDQPNIALKAMTSNRARLMVPATNTQAPANRPTKTNPVVSISRFGKRCIMKGLVSRSPAKPRTIAAATRSCTNPLVVSGTHPTRARLAPTTEKRMRAVTAVPRRTCVPSSGRSWRAAARANSSTVDPPRMSVPLKNIADASP